MKNLKKIFFWKIFYFLFIKYIYPRKPLRARMPTNMERDKKKIKIKT